jgi:hypothetical protein
MVSKTDSSVRTSITEELADGTIKADEDILGFN